MAMNINPTVIGKAFEKHSLTLTGISGSIKKSELTCDISGAGDVLYVIVDLSACASDSYSVKFKPGDHNKTGDVKTVALTNAKINVIPVTSLEIKKFNGTASFEIETTATAGFSSASPRVGLIKYAPVVNH